MSRTIESSDETVERKGSGMTREAVSWLPCRITDAGPLGHRRNYPKIASATRGWAAGSWKIDIFTFTRCVQIWSNGWNADCDALRDAGIGPAMIALAAESSKPANVVLSDGGEKVKPKE